MASDTVDQKAAPAGVVKSAERVLAIFKYFDKHRVPKTLSEISHDLSYPVSSALALLRSVQSAGFLTYDFEAKTYFPSIRFAMLGQWLHDKLFQGGAVVQLMEQLAAVTNETVSLGVQNGLQSQHVHIIQTSQPLSYRPVVGTLRPLLRSAVGRVLLSRQERATVLKVVERINASGADERRVYDLQEVLDDLERVKKAGYAFSANVFTKGAAIVAVALPPRAGDVPMAVAISGPTSRMDRKAIPALIAQIDAEIARYAQSAHLRLSTEDSEAGE